jgi:hypothetical protein
MRRLLLLTLLVCLAAPAAAFALGQSPGDGTLVVRNGAGSLRLDISGAVIGRFDGGRLEVTSPTLNDCDDLDVWGADRERTVSLRDGTTTCLFTEFPTLGTPEPIRFRIVLDDDESLAIRGGVDFSLSAVGRGHGQIKGVGGLDGSYALNGDRSFRSLPDDGLSFDLGATLP